ncbi:MAG: ABC transporter permease [Faecalicatena sp.]|uniref:ABC transporter permease n=1 Tax=Faecalicatena sp. TaxID=2005360 RepID=UPI0025896CC5|nr:ABC transporter permease [Faecalicatena sp.]MCI6466486.1 ABC transporter permease [Faecalicatena sp.]MDY5620072.1 ABC transporter permease [Lachnospiraceae bacterium]
MKILREYVWDSLRRNKRTSLAIMTALFLMTTLMSCFCGFVYTMWTDAIALSVNENGNWHGELFDTTKGSDLEQVKNYASVSAVMIKGNWEVAKLSDTGKRNYLLSRGANAEYWNSMPEKKLVTDGRLPENENELAVSKQYFDDHPDVSLGDELTLPVGQRIYQGQVCKETDAFHENEDFRQTGTRTYRLVGIMDVTTSSSVPAYTAMSFLDEKKIKPEDDLTVYLRFNSIRSTYKELPALAESIGYEKDEYGKYLLRYNVDLLTKYAVLPPEQITSIDNLAILSVPLMFLILAVLLISVFVIVIHNAFALSANEKLAQLGTLAGIGASPKQIKAAVSSEALILLLPPLPLGLFCGWLLDAKLFDLINANNDIGRSAPDIVMSFGLPAVLPAILLSAITAWLSARIPAKKVAKMMPVEALRHTETLKGKKIRRSRISGRFGISGELASNALTARRKSYRTATISLCLSFVLLTGFLYITTAQEAASEVYRAQNNQKGHILLSISDGREPEQKALDEMKKVPGIASYVFYDKMPCATWITADQASDDIETHLGGFDQIVSEKKYTPIERDGKYRIYSVLIGLERDSFLEYCNKIGIDPEPYLSDPSKALFYNKTADPHASTRRENVYRNILKLEKGQVIPFTEQAYDEDTGNFQFDLTVGDIVEELPLPVLNELPRFTLTAIMPMDHVMNLAASCSDKRRMNASTVLGRFMTSAADEVSYPKIETSSEDLKQILDHYYGSGDYMLTNIAEEEEMQKETNSVMSTVVGFLTGLLALIGISNIWASISGNLRQRSREFAMLKSTGLSPNQLWRMLFLEGLTLGLKPLLYSLPLQIAILAAFLSINEITLAEYLPFAPFKVLLGYTALVLLTIIGAYFAGGRRIQKQNIIEAIKDDTL